ncbi:hypothetical membrane protein [Thermoplasma acidophilum]|uniref:Hypothetical membrane protein n=1 Tax=Thermoplasma acidophilum (strain ATCC 25905 / DSM 1728 / JCM 9062 / NBRC 15155 / AMRC-C165) TaxID=273075 RepID=Q9HJ70_THEAC|nr:hypothetical protein [Thermoplasma acidophilum]MCY0851835.1 hypothetical protein [Thermoplasma acidophilum]CAC12229.1 hypothetical membrane protein [Thermoplasma acidophilum]
MNKVIIAVIVAIITIPSFTLISAGHEYYNFSGQSPGSFPANSTNFSFSVINDVSGAKIGIKDIYGRLGLNIFSLDLDSNGTYLNISFDRRIGQDLAFVFNYSENGIGGADINDIILRSQGSGIAMDFSNSQNLEEYSPITAHTGTTVSANIIYTMKFAFFHNQTLVFLNTSSDGLNMPIDFNTSIPAGETSLLIGSNAVNMTLYNISLGNYPINLTQDSGLYSTYYTDLPYENGTYYYPDYTRNSIIGINETGIYVSNYLNMSTYRILHDDFTTFSAYGNTLYAAEAAGNETEIVSVNLSTLTVAEIGDVHLNLTGYREYAAFDYIFMFNKSTTYAYSLENRNVKMIGYGTFEYYNASNSSVWMYNDSSRENIAYFMSNGTVVEGAFSNTTDRIGGISDGSTCILYNANGIGVYGDHMIFGKVDASVGLFYQNSDVIIGNRIIGTGTHVYYASASNSSYILVAIGGSITILYTGVVVPINGSISVNFYQPRYIRGYSWLNFTVDSAYPYRAILRIGNISETAFGNSSFPIDSALLNNGTQNISLYVNNSIGYRREYSGSIFVDNYVPLITSSLGNGSYVLLDQNVSIGIEDDPIVSEVAISINGVDHLYAGNASLVLNQTGMDYVNVSVIDRFGIVFRDDLVYHVYRMENFSVSIYSGEYFSTSDIPVTLYPAGYNFTVASAGVIAHGNDTVIIQGHEGINNLTVYVSYHGKNITVFTGYVNVITFAPLLTVNSTESRFYSFYGNSRNNTMHLNVSANVSSDIFIHILYKGGEIASFSFVNRASITFNGSSPYFITNGNYTIAIEAVSPSGTESYQNISIYENSTVPESLSYRIFTNSTNVTVPFSTRNLIYNFSIDENVLALPGYGNYTFLFYNYTSTGNYGVIKLYVEASLCRPRIYAEFANETANGSAYLLVSVRQQNVTDIMIRIGNTAYYANNGTVLYRIRSDGNLTVNVSGRNVYGNANYSVYELQEYPYPEIRSVSITSHVSLLTTRLRIQVHGYHISGYKVTWYINGRQYEGYNVSMANRPGPNVVIVKVSIGNASGKAAYRFYSPSYMAFSPAVIAVVPPIYLATRNRDLEHLHELITSSGGSSVKDVLRVARRKRFTRKQVVRAIEDERARNSISVETDPDGHEFIVGRE